MIPTISFEQNGDMTVAAKKNGTTYIGRVDSDGDIRLVPGDEDFEVSEVVEEIIATMNYDPDITYSTWNIDFTRAVVKAGEKDRIPEAYLRQARIDEYREPSMSEWWSALKDAEEREECIDGDGNVVARFWTDGERIWATPENIIEPGARQIKYRFEAGADYVPVDL